MAIRGGGWEEMKATNIKKAAARQRVFRLYQKLWSNVCLCFVPPSTIVSGTPSLFSFKRVGRWEVVAAAEFSKNVCLSIYVCQNDDWPGRQRGVRQYKTASRSCCRFTTSPKQEESTRKVPSVLLNTSPTNYSYLKSSLYLLSGSHERPHKLNDRFANLRAAGTSNALLAI